MKIIGAVWPRSGLSNVQFRAYYREVHGPIVAAEPGETLRYVQNPVEDAVIYHSDPRPPVTVPAALTELWYKDEAGAAATFSAQYALEVSAADVVNYADLSRNVGLMGEECEIVAGKGEDGLTKTMIQCLLLSHTDVFVPEFAKLIESKLGGMDLSDAGIALCRVATEADRKSDLVKAFGSAAGRPRCVAAITLFLDDGAGWNRPQIASALERITGDAFGCEAFTLEMLLSPHLVFDKTNRP